MPMDARLHEILTLAEGGDEDVLLQVQSEIALMPETREQLMQREIEWAERYAESFAPAKEEVSAEELDKLAEDADF